MDIQASLRTILRATMEDHVAAMIDIHHDMIHNGDEDILAFNRAMTIEAHLDTYLEQVADRYLDEILADLNIDAPIENKANMRVKEMAVAIMAEDKALALKISLLGLYIKGAPGVTQEVVLQ